MITFSAVQAMIILTAGTGNDTLTGGAGDVVLYARMVMTRWMAGMAMTRLTAVRGMICLSPAQLKDITQAVSLS